MADNVDELLNCHASSCEEYSSFILSCNMIGRRENKSRYVTEIVFWLGFADVIFGGASDRENTSTFAGYLKRVSRLK